MTVADLDAIAKALDAERARWAEKLVRRVESVMDDALAHAEKAITDALKATSDGRPTVRRANRSPSFLAALGRLDTLHVWLAGRSSVSLVGKVRDAREFFYRIAFLSHRQLLPKEIRISDDPQPPRHGVNLIRGAAVHGIDPYRELEGPIGTAKRDLLAAVARAGASTITARSGSDIMRHWRDNSAAAIVRTVHILLADSVVYCDSEARHDLIHPDLRGD